MPGLRKLCALASVVCAALASAGCPPNLSPWKIAGSGPGPHSDGGPNPGPHADGGPRPPGPDGSVNPGTGGPCPAPVLLAAAQDTSGHAGRVLRFQILSTGELVRCGDVTAGGMLEPTPWAVAGVGDSYLLVGSDDRVQGVDPRTDQILFSQSPSTGNLHPNDAFALDDTTWGDRVAGIAWSGVGTSSTSRGTVTHVELYTSSGTFRDQWTGSTLMLGATTSLAESPHAAGQLVALDDGVFAADELDPFATPHSITTVLGADSGGIVLRSISGGHGSGGGPILTWTGTSNTYETVFVSEGDPWSGVQVSELQCPTMPCTTLVHSAVDPTVAQGAFAICYDGGPGSIVRVDVAHPDDCPTVLDTFALDQNLRLTYLYVVQ